VPFRRLVHSRAHSGHIARGDSPRAACAPEEIGQSACHARLWAFSVIRGSAPSYYWPGCHIQTNLLEWMAIHIDASGWLIRRFGCRHSHMRSNFVAACRDGTEIAFKSLGIWGMSVTVRVQVSEGAGRHAALRRRRCSRISSKQRNMTSSSRFLTFTPWCGQLNNTRMCFETALVLAYLGDRTLVIPNGYRRNDEPEFVGGIFRPLHPQEYLDMRSVNRIVNMVTYRKYMAELRNTDVIDLIFDVNTAVFCYPVIPKWGSVSSAKLLAYAAGRSVFLEFTNSMRRCTTLNIKNPMLEHFYTFCFFSNAERTKECKLLIRDHVRFKPAISHLGNQIASHLGFFNAVHVRRSDFIRQYPNQNIPARSILENLKKYVTPRTKLYVSTDELDHNYFKPLRKYYEVMFLHDVLDTSRRGMARPLLSCLEQTICSLAHIFVGTRFSTFSGYITRLRGYGDVSNKEIYFTDGYEIRGDDEFSWLRWIKAGNPFWGREYREGWET
jgi:hypothetical protein